MITTLNDFVNKDDLTPEYFMKRVPFFKDFENLSGEKIIKFQHFKNFHNEAVIKFLDDLLTIPYLSVETNFNMFQQTNRDFEREEQEKRHHLIKKQYYFTYWTSIHVTNPEIETKNDIIKNIITKMLTKIFENNLKFQDSFIVKEGDEIPKEQIDSMVNKINKNLFRIEDILENMYVSYF